MFCAVASPLVDRNSALQRARATLDELDLEDAEAPTRPSTEDESRYDVVFDMPPLPLWVRGPADVADFMLGPGASCRGSKLIATSANGLPAFASYKPDPESGAWLPWSLTLLEAESGAAGVGGGSGAPTVTGVHNFLAPLMPNLFASFGLPERLGDADPVIAASP